VNLVLKKEITGPMAWKGLELSKERSWILKLSESDVTALDDALNNLKKSKKLGLGFNKDDFLIPSWEDMLTDLADVLENGRGFCVMRGLPVDKYTEDEIRAIYFGIGLNLGIPVRQNPKGDLLGEVMNIADSTRKTSRVYETNAYLPYHTDPSDVVGLLCLRKAKDGASAALLASPPSTTKFSSDTPNTSAYYIVLGITHTLVKISRAFRRCLVTIMVKWHSGICDSISSLVTR
jgi:hypothetical protein